MTPRFLRLGAALLLAAAAGGVSAADAPTTILGTKPAHITEASVPDNEAALGTRIWAPGIDEGYVPQGVAFIDGHVYVSSYKSTEPKVGTGPTRVYRIDPKTGASTHFDMPAECTHAGGLVHLGGDLLLVADTRRLFKVDMKKAFADGTAANGAILSSISLAGEMKGSLVDFDGSNIFIASSEKAADKAKAFFLPVSLFDTHKGQVIAPESVVRSFPVIVDAQGAAFDKNGGLWLSASNSKWGKLQKLDPQTGAVLAQYDMVIGIEDIGFDPQGRLWAVSEAGSLRWAKWSKSYPVVFEIDIAKLK